MADSTSMAPRAWTWKGEARTRNIFDFSKFDNQFDRYTAATRAPTWRNRGPRGRCEGNMSYKKFAAACDFSFPAGATNAKGEPIPQGAYLKCRAVSPFAPSRRQGLRLLRQARRRYPTAYLALWEFIKGAPPLTVRETGQMVMPTSASQGQRGVAHV